MTAEEFSHLSNEIPAMPGIYKYFDDAGNLIYVGKAKHLRKRVSSYFNRSVDNKKTIELVKRIQKIEFTIVDSEEDAFLLENNLIKEYQPVYNINLKDDKGYPYVVIKKERFPRVFISRKKISDGSFYFGPYTSIGAVMEMISFIKQNFPLRTCKLNLTENNIRKKKFKVCLEYHLGNCKGPCEALQSLEEYDEGIQQLISLLKGNIKPVIQYFKSEIKKHVENLAFEKAAVLQSKVNGLIQYQAKSAVINTNTGTIDVFSIIDDEQNAFVNYLSVNNGSVIHTKTIIIDKKLEETNEEILIFSIARLRQLFSSEAKEIVVPFAFEYPQKEIKCTVPKLGDKKKLLELSLKNVQYFKEMIEAKKRLQLHKETEKETEAILQLIQDDLKLPAIPTHIECFDNSNLHGTNPVAAMVCFKNGVPSKKDYRHFNIKTVEGINDFASMKEIVFRRYKKLLDESLPLPQLIIIDGGKGQLSAALESIEALELTGKVTLVGLAKNKEEIFFSGDKESLLLPWDSKSLLMIRKIRDEVHRFGITFHRKKRSIAAIKNELESIEGVGTSTAEKLLREFKSVKKIKELNLEQLEKSIGKSKAETVYNALHLFLKD